jgi:glycosyltransferase involved in cell wall biosynthesis
MYPVDSRVELIQELRVSSANRIGRRLRRFCKITRQIYSLCINNHTDVVVDVLSCHWLELRVATWLVSHKVKVVQTDHNVCELPKPIKMSISKKLIKFVWPRLFDLVTVLTEADLKVMLAKGFKNAVALHNPLFLIPSTQSIPTKQKVVLSVGRLDAWYVKGFDLLAAAWNKVAPQHPDWKLRIVGHGNDEIVATLKSWFNDSKTIEIVPYTSNPKALYEEASIYVLSSRYEGWGLVLVEAMSQGCASIACDFRGRQSEIVTDGENGLICETDNADALADKINRLIEDEPLRNRLQWAAPQSVERFSEVNVAKRLDELFRI